MPTIDVTAVLMDPRFCQDFQIARIIRTVSSETGRAETQKTFITASGVIHPLNEEELSRMPEGDRNNSYVTVWTRTKLSTGDLDQAPDEVFYRGTSWRVQRMQDWSRYGKGFYKALCVQQYDSEAGDY